MSSKLETIHSLLWTIHYMKNNAIPMKGERLCGIVQRATEFRCILLAGGKRARLIAPQNHPWSKYRILFESGYLASGRTLEVVVEKWDPRLKSLLVKLPPPSVEFTNKSIEGKVIFLRARYIKQHKHRLQNVIYAEIGPGELARIEAYDLKIVEKAFPIGSRIPLVVGEPDKYAFLHRADIDWGETRFSEPTQFPIGTRIEALVIRLAPYGATCLLADRVVGFLHRDSILGVHSENRSLLDYLHPGDSVKIEVRGEIDEEHGTYKLEYVGEEMLSHNQQQELELALIDADARRAIQTSEKFSRDRNFRWCVIEAYDERCCICGNRFTIGDSSAMEAAHIIPRAERGRDTLDNGLCLCPVHHWAFDQGLLAIDDKLVIAVASIARQPDDEGSWLAPLHGHVAHLADGAHVNRAALMWHMRNIFIDEV